MITRHKKALSPTKIKRLAEMAAQPKGTQTVKKALGKLRTVLRDTSEVLRDFCRERRSRNIQIGEYRIRLLQA